jgi:hypothetical protein
VDPISRDKREYFCTSTSLARHLVLNASQMTNIDVMSNTQLRRLYFDTPPNSVNISLTDLASVYATEIPSLESITWDKTVIVRFLLSHNGVRTEEERWRVPSWTKPRGVDFWIEG